MLRCHLAPRPDWSTKTNVTFDGVQPNVQNNWAGAGAGGGRGKSFRSASNGGHFYVFMEKEGSLASKASYVPFKHYVPDSRKLEAWVGTKKLSLEQFDLYSSKVVAGHARRHADVEAVKRTREEEASMGSPTFWPRRSIPT